MMFNLSKPLLRDLGVNTAHRGLLNGLRPGPRSLGGSSAAFVGRGARAHVPPSYSQNLGIPLYIAMAVLRPHLAAIAAIVLVEQLAGGSG